MPSKLSVITELERYGPVQCIVMESLLVLLELGSRGDGSARWSLHGSYANPVSLSPMTPLWLDGPLYGTS